MASGGPQTKPVQDGISGEGGMPSLASIVLLGTTQAAVLLGEDRVRRAGEGCEQAAAAVWAGLGDAGREAWAGLAGAWAAARAREGEFCRSLGLSGALERSLDTLLLLFTASCAALCAGVSLHIAFVLAAGSLASVSLLLGLFSGLLFSVSGALLILVTLVVGPGALLAGLLAAGLVTVVAIPGASLVFRDRFLAAMCQNLYSEEALAAHDDDNDNFELVHSAEAEGAAKAAGRSQEEPDQAAAPAPSVEKASGFWPRKRAGEAPLAKSQVA